MYIIVCPRPPQNENSSKEYQWDYFGPFEGQDHAVLWLNAVHKSKSRTGRPNYSPLKPAKNETDPEILKRIDKYNSNYEPCTVKDHWIVEVKYPYTGFEAHYY